MASKEPFQLTLKECYQVLSNQFVSTSEEVKYRNLTMLQAEKLMGLRGRSDHSLPKLYGNSLLERIKSELE
ncbi:hypothetical protein KMW28_07270 [Flammeovirga yaeyamensis]|uniref:Uncharacterized protein n=1 Tax=Flammeovirga yaeyamensis TaxID=367791 RepID=A0AAX1N840_9BACT|nr:MULTISPECIES: hypothetical protein [Flammeovirga]ANQ49157.1 hypothetical protein MY04_1783 [Flammeovirga sp. MY04]MBB3697980.1 hypothetical protein [Flammeovirga yaeyamensis]NMF35668.1 hypothetical protein [Flammeovirga yaeyamensis]QWG03377.1 hypothetical protein KMW28_07270 [Flammeovirga yaeyamensis]